VPDLYATIGVPRSATKAEIRKAYRKAAKRAHPDGGGSPEAFRRVQTAQLVLIDDARRARYDETGKFEDDPPVDIREAMALEQVSLALDIALANVMRFNGDPRQADMTAETKKVIGELRRKVDQEIAAFEKAATQWEKLRNRFAAKKEGVPNRLEALVAGKLSQITMMTAQAKSRHESLGAAEAILDAHTYRRDKAESAPQGPMNMSLAQLMGRGF
jgi:curved DNA-binding protein CbpA